MRPLIAFYLARDLPHRPPANMVIVAQIPFKFMERTLKNSLRKSPTEAASLLKLNNRHVPCDLVGSSIKTMSYIVPGDQGMRKVGAVRTYMTC